VNVATDVSGDLNDLHRLPSVVDITTAGKALGLSRTRAYELAKRGEFPCRLIRIGESYRVPTAELLRLLGDKTMKRSRTTWPPRSVIRPLTCYFTVAGEGFEPSTSGL
jgi:predicted DNA-binding transcriptional regulator AlpA